MATTTSPTPARSQRKNRAKPRIMLPLTRGFTRYLKPGDKAEFASFSDVAKANPWLEPVSQWLGMDIPDVVLALCSYDPELEAEIADTREYEPRCRAAARRGEPIPPYAVPTGPAVQGLTAKDIASAVKASREKDAP